MRLQTPAILIFLPLALALSGCGGGSGGGGGDPTPTAGPNDAPTIQAPGQLSGGPVQFTYVLPIAGSQVLTFNAADINGDTLNWQVAVSASGATAAGLTFASPAFGPTFTVSLGPVASPVTANLNVLVEDPRGAAAAIDILLVRSGLPEVTGISRSSAFATAAQDVTISGGAFALGNTVNTIASFSGIVADNIAVVDESTLTCTTPLAASLGVNTVAVSNQFGGTILQTGTFTMYSYPVDLLDNDTAFDSGGGAQLVTANVGARMHAAWVEGGAVLLSTSLDGGAIWSAAMTLSGAELPSSLRIAVDGDTVVVAWIGNITGLGGSLHVRTSIDAGLAFDPIVELAASSAFTPAICVSEQYMHCAWMKSDPGVQKVWVASSTTTGSVWNAGKPAYTTIDNQSQPAIGCLGGDAWISLRQGVDQRLHTTHTSNAGFFWSAGVARSSVAAVPDLAPALFCNDGQRVFMVWADDGALQYMVSENAGLGWPTLQSVLRAADLGVISAANAATYCEEDRLVAAYVAGGSNVAFTRIGASGAVPEHVTLSTVVEPARQPSIALRGSYVFAAWSGGDVGAGTARIKLATSTNRGVTFIGPSTFGDGAAVQDAPRMIVDDARIWMGWVDSRGVGPALFHNRTEQ
ncbi:MAG: hypothetical protein ACI89X_003466 [Planctomycetota bacterium]|jgi:hypothetical protein